MTDELKVAAVGGTAGGLAPGRVEPTLVRGLGLREASTLIIGGTIGASIFLVPAGVAAEVGSPALALATWAVAGLVAVCGALSFAELAATMPTTGGTYAFLKGAYPRTPIAFLFGWMMFFAYASAATAVTATMASLYAWHFLGEVVPAGVWGVRLLAVAVILTLATVNWIGVRQGGRLQNLTTYVKVGMMAAVIVICFALAPGGSEIGLLPATPSGTGPLTAASSVGAAMMLCLFSYSGWFFVTHVAGEVQEPQRTLPRAIFLSMAVVIALYLAINTAFLYVLPFDTLRESDRVAVAAVEAVFTSRGADVMALVVVMSAVGSNNAQLLNYPRVVFSLARDAPAFRLLARVHPVNRTPSTAIIVFALLACGYALAGTYTQILSYVTFVGQWFMALTVAGLIVLRIRRPDLPRPYRVWGYPFTPLVYIVILALFLGNLLVHYTAASMVGIGIVALGVPVWWLGRRSSPALALRTTEEP